jgi:hypothetical protein
MFENADQQLVALAITEEQDFLATVRNCIVIEEPELDGDPTLFKRLVSAYGEAKRLGLTADALLVEFLYLEIRAPGFLRNPAILKWLEKPNGSIDSRFEDLLAVLRKKLGDTQEEA